MSKDIPISRVRELYQYHPESGALTRRIRQGRMMPGTVAGSRDFRGHIIVGIDGRDMNVVKVVFAIHHGYWPSRISFIDGDRSNTRVENVAAEYTPRKGTPSTERLHELFYVDGDVLRWKVATRCTRPGDPAGGANSDEYLRLSVDGVRLPVHRVIWAMHHGRWPADGMVIDHIDGNPANNKIENLRELTWQGNAQNRTKPSRANRTGTRVPGVSWNSQLGKYAINLRVDGKTKFLGSYDDLAVAERDAVRLRREHYPANTF